MSRPAFKLFGLILGLVIGVSARPRIPSLLQIPSADILPHGLFNAHSHVNFFSASEFEGDSARSLQFPFSSGVILGFQNRAQFGFQFGDKVSLSFRAYIIEAPEGLYNPDIAIGARSIFGSQEGRLFGVQSEDTLDILRNEAYVAFSMNLSPTNRFHGGASVIPGVDDGEAMFFLGMEQYLGAGFYLGYELVNRFLELNHHLTLLFKMKNYFSMMVGLSQLQNWLVQDGEWGFYPVPQTYSTNGYHSPGIKIGVSMGGYTLRSNRKTIREKLVEISSEQQDFRVALTNISTNVEKNASKLEAVERRDTKVKSLETKQVTDYLSMISDKLNSDVPYDPLEVAKLRNEVLQLPPSSTQIMKRIVTNPTTNIEHRVQACIIMALSGREEYIKPLLQATNDPEPRVRREAILSLANMKLKVALEYAEVLLDDTDDNVVMAAKEAIRRIKAAAGQGQARQQEAEVP